MVRQVCTKCQMGIIGYKVVLRCTMGYQGFRGIRSGTARETRRLQR